MRALSYYLLLLPLFGISTGCVTNNGGNQSLKNSLTLYASFDHGLDADFALGDPKLYGATSSSKTATAPAGLPTGGAIEVAKGVGKTGDALRYIKKSSAVTFFKNPGNFDYQRTNWNGTISFWLKLDPDKDLEPGYCDPLQVAAGDWNNGVFFAEFSKDTTPRHFRFAMRPLGKIYNPKNLGWEVIPVKDRPMVEIQNPPFSREKWTHVLFTFSNANTGAKNGVGKLYLDGALAGEFPNWDLTVNWKPEQILVIIGASYVGLFDELALFNRALSSAEAKKIYSQKNLLPQLTSK